MINAYTETNELMKEWRQRHKTKYPEKVKEFGEELSFYSDGIMDETEWAKTDKKMLFILKETYNSPEFKHAYGHIREADILCASGPHQVQKNMFYWAKGIFETNKSGIAPLDKDLGANYKNYMETMKKVAVINLKKSMGESSSAESGWEKIAKDDKDLLLRQIAEISPNIIVCGGTFGTCAETIFDGDGMYSLKKEYRDSNKGLIENPNRYYKLNNGCTVIDSCHPSMRIAYDSTKYFGVVSPYYLSLK